MHGGFIVMALMKLFVMFGFAFIIWVLAAKEDASVKLIGQVIAVAILVLALLSTVTTGYMHRQWTGSGMDMQKQSCGIGSSDTGTNAGNNAAAPAAPHSKRIWKK